MVLPNSLSSYYEKFLATGEVKCIDDEIPFEIPKGWEWTRIRNISQSYIGLTYSPTDVSSRGTIVLRSSNIQDGKIVLNDVVRVSKEISEKLQVEKNDIIICARNGSAKLVGKSAVVTDVTEPMTFGAFMAICKTALYQYVSIFLQSDLFFSQLRGVSGTTTINQLTQNNFNDFWIPIPPANEQKRIVEKLQNVSPFIERYSKSQETLNLMNIQIKEQLKKSILQEAIQGKLVPQIAEEGTAQELLEQIQQEKQKLVKEGKLKKSVLTDSVIYKGDDNKNWEKKGTTCECIDEDIPFDIPKSWAWARLETILNTGSARRVHAKDWRQAGIPFYRAREIGKLADDGFVDNELYIDLSLYEDFSSSGVPLPNDLMVTAVGTLGKVYIVKESDKFYYKDGSVLCLANKYGLCAEYLKMVIESPFFKGQYRQESQGTTVATLTMVRLQKYFIPIPPLQEQYRIVETYRNIASIMS